MSFNNMHMYLFFWLRLSRAANRQLYIAYMLTYFCNNFKCVWLKNTTKAILKYAVLSFAAPDHYKDGYM